MSLAARPLRLRRAAGSADPSAPPSQPSLAWATRRRLLFAGIGAATYVVALLATLPAAFVIPRGAAIAALGGTIWHGTAALAGGDRLEWRWAPLRTLANLGLAADFTVDGAGTALAGHAILASGSVRLDDVSGTADAALVTALMPQLGLSCTMPLQIDLAQLVLGAGERRIAGRATSEPGTCAKGGAATPVPALAFNAEHVGRVSTATLAPAAQRRRTLATLTLAEDGAATIAVTRDGAAVLPFVAPPQGMTVETKL